MKKLVPFKKDILFKTNIFEITSISLEHTLKKTGDNLISGEFIVSGDYKITDTPNTDPFTFNLPFDIELDSDYILDKASASIDDFYYEIVDENILRVIISISIDNLEKKEVKLNEVKIERSNELIEKLEGDDMRMCIEQENVSSSKKDIEEEKRCVEEENVNKDIGNLFEIDESEEKFSTYRVYIVREDDTIESILNKYDINKEKLEEYNDLTDIKVGNKIIIPS